MIGCDRNRSDNNPALYYFGSVYHRGNGAGTLPFFTQSVTGRAQCHKEVRPFTEFDPTDLPTFSMIIPTLVPWSC